MTIQVEDDGFSDAPLPMVNHHPHLEWPTSVWFSQDKYMAGVVAKPQSFSFLGVGPKNPSSTPEDSVPVTSFPSLFIRECEKMTLQAEDGNEIAEIDCLVGRVNSPCGWEDGSRCEVDFYPRSNSLPSVFNMSLVQEHACNVDLLQALTLRGG